MAAVNIASETKIGGQVKITQSAAATLIATLAADTDVVASSTAPAKVTAVSDELNNSIYLSALPVAVVINGTPTKNQIRAALANISALLDRNSLYSE